MPSPYVFPACSAKGRGKDGEDRDEGERWKQASISAWFRRNVAKRAAELDLDLDRLDQKYGALGLHVIRLLYGSHFVQTHPLQTSLMLSHRSMEFTVKLYSGLTEKQASLEVDPEEIDVQSGARQTRNEHEVALLRENRELRQRMAELEHRLGEEGPRASDLDANVGEAA